MAESSLRPVGVQMVAQGADDYIQKVGAVSQATQQLVGGLKTAIEGMLQQGASVEQVRAFYAQYGGDMSQVNAILAQYAAATKGATSALKEFNAETGLHMKLLPEQAAGVRENIALYESLPTTLRKTTDAHQGHINVMGESRMMLKVVTAEMALMALTSGETLPQGLKEAAKGLQEVVQIGTMGFMAGGPTGLVLGAIAGGILVIGTAAMSVDPQIVALNKHLDDLAKKDDVVEGFKKMTGAEDETAIAALKWIDAHKDVARQIKEIEESGKPAIPILTGLGDALGVFFDVGTNARDTLALGMGLAEFRNQLMQGKDVLDAWNQGWSAARDFQRGYTDATVDATRAILDEAAALQLTLEYNAKALPLLKQYEGMVESLAEKEYQFHETNRKAWNDRVDAIQKANQVYGDAVLKAGRDLQDRLGDIEDSGEITRQRARNQSAQIVRGLNEQLADSDEQLADRKSDIATNERDKEEDLAYGLQRKLSELDYERARERQQLADKLLVIAREEREKIADLDLQTGLKLRKAKTEHEADELQFMAQIERNQIQRGANDRRDDAGRAMKDWDDLSKHKQDLALQDYKHAIDIAQREQREQIAIAERTWREQTARAKRAGVDRENDLADQLRIEGKMLENQIADARRRNKEQKDDALLRWGEETTTIKGHYQTQIDENQRAYDHWKELEDAKMAKLLADMRQLESQYPFLFPTANRPSGGWTGGNPYVGVTSAQHGANFVVPPGYPNDSFNLKVSSDEHVIVVPPGSGSVAPPLGGGNYATAMTFGAGAFQFSIDARGQNDPNAIANAVMAQVAKDFPRLLDKTMNQGVFR